MGSIQPNESQLRYIYDGTFEGFLTAVNVGRRQPARVHGIGTDEEQPDLFSETIEIETDAEKAEQIFEYLRKNYGEEVVLDILYAFLSEVKGIELNLFRFILDLWRFGERASENYANDDVVTVKRTRERVAHEILRFQGFVRFRRLKNGVYYAPISPDANIVQFLAPHFSVRFADQSWVIHDTRRHVGLYYDGRQCRYLYSIEMSSGSLSACQDQNSHDFTAIFSENEGDIQRLWQQYFEAIAIKERINPRLQRQRLPLRYWQNLTEKPLE